MAEQHPETRSADVETAEIHPGDHPDAGRLHVVGVQAASTLDPTQNAAALRDLVARAAAEARERNTVDDDVLVVFPEVFQRDFGKPGTDLAEFAEPLDGEFVTALTAAAVEHNVTVVAGMFRTNPDGGRPLNTLVLRRPDGTGVEYDKIHLYDSFGYKESDRLAAGEWQPVTVTLGGLTLGLMTCYDLRFPELARALVDAGVDAIVLPAAWVAGDRKVDHWRTLTKARAIENTVYVVAVGQPAQRYSGHSLVVSPAGDVLVEAGLGDVDTPVLVHAVLHATEVASARGVNPSLANRRR